MRNARIINNKEEMDTLYREGRISRTTWWRGRKRGYLYVGYHTREICSNNPQSLPVDMIYNICWRVARIYFGDLCYQDKEDLVQEAICRVLELSGKEDTKAPKYVFGVALNTMRAFFRKYYKKRGMVGEVGEEIDYSQNIQFWLALQIHLTLKEWVEIENFLKGKTDWLSDGLIAKIKEIIF